MARNPKIKWLLVWVILWLTVLQTISAQEANSTVLKTYESVSDDKNNTLPATEPPKNSGAEAPKVIQLRTGSYGKIVSLLLSSL